MTSAASPRPAAMPAMGPSQREAPDGAAAGEDAVPAAGVVAGEAGVVGCAEALLAGAAAGGADFDGVTLWRCAPKLRPPPIRPASARSLRASVRVANAARSRIGVRFMGTSVAGPDGGEYAECKAARPSNLSRHQEDRPRLFWLCSGCRPSGTTGYWPRRASASRMGALEILIAPPNGLFNSSMRKIEPETDSA